MPFPTPASSPLAVRRSITARRIALAYAALAVAWIVGSDRLLARLVPDPVTLTRMQTVKGWAFVLATALLLYTLIRAALAAEQRAAEALRASDAALRERDSTFRAVFEGAGVGICISGLDMQIVRTNPALDDMLGYAPGELVGRPIERLWDLDDPDSDPADRHSRLRALVSTGTPYRVDCRYRRKDGTSVPVSLTVSLALDEHGEPRHQVAIVKDLREQLSAQAALAESEARLRQAQKMEAVGRLAGGVAHDFNNLLTAIGGYADLAVGALGELVADRLGRTERVAALAAARDDVQEVRRAADRAASVTQQLLAFSRKQVLQPTALDLNAVVGGVEKLVRRLVGDTVRMETALAPAVGPVRADRGRLEQVVMNLVLNARDAMPEGGTLTIETGETEVDAARAAALPGMRPGRYGTVAVRDTGVGMDAATHARLFEPFFTTKPVGHGTGLGLATAYGIVKQSDGFVYAESSPGRGSTFTVYLPLADGPSEGAPAPQPAPAERPRATGRTVLVVDDEPTVRDTTRRLLERNGYRVSVAEDGVAALSTWEAAGGVDLVVTDLAMPGMGGRELVRRLRERAPDARVLCMSGFAGTPTVGDDLVMEKPFTAAELLGRVREALGA